MPAAYIDKRLFEGEEIMVLFCPICKTTHELSFSETEEQQVVDGREFKFIKSSVKCNKTGLEKSDVRLKKPEEKDQLAYATARQLVKELPDGLKEKMIRELKTDWDLAQRS